MSPRGVEPLGTDEHGYETHPAMVQVHVNRVSSTPSQVLFDSDLKHGHYMVLKVSGASRKRDLHRDWIHGKVQPMIEIAMSFAQWAELVSSTNAGGVSATLQYYNGELVPSMPYEPRLKMTMDEAAGAADEVFKRALVALEAAEAKPTKANLRALRLAMESAKPNVDYATKTVTEHTEAVVTKARADIEAMVGSAAERQGLALTDAGFALAIGGDAIDAEVLDESEIDDETWGAGPAPRIGESS